MFVTADGPIAYRRGAFSVSQVPLKLGRQNDKFVEVLSGIHANDLVLQPKTDEKEQTKS